MTYEGAHFPRTYSERFTVRGESGLRFVASCACGWRSEGRISASGAQREALQHRMRAQRGALVQGDTP